MIGVGFGRMGRFRKGAWYRCNGDTGTGTDVHIR